jgi:Mu transposase, C-terminal
MPFIGIYLEERHGYGPRKARDDTNYAYRRLEGYNRDPALVVPALRYLLPIEHATVGEDGMVTVAKRQYRDPLLVSWRGQPVDVRISRQHPSQVYVYLDGAIFCQAHEAAEGTQSESLVSPRITSSNVPEGCSKGPRRYLAVNPECVPNRSQKTSCKRKSAPTAIQSHRCNQKPAITASENQRYCK